MKTRVQWKWFFVPHRQAEVIQSNIVCYSLEMEKIKSIRCDEYLSVFRGLVFVLTDVFCTESDWSK